MADWGVLGLGGNPAPGDPGQVRQLAQRFASQAELLHNTGFRLSSLASSSDELGMAGDYAPGFEHALNELPGELSTSERAYRECGQALATFSSRLEHAQSVAGRALRQGQVADVQLAGVMQQIRNLLPADRVLTISPELGFSEWRVDAATTGLDESLRDQVRVAARRGRQAESDRDAARQLALQAAALRGDAESRCTSEIDNSLRPIKNRSWWEKAWDTTTGAITWPFSSWDHFVTFCAVAGAVLGVVALFLSGPIGWTIAGAAIAASTVSLADTAMKFNRGEAGLLTMGFAILSVIPGLSAGSKVTGLLGRLTRDLPFAGQAFRAATQVASRIGSAARSVGTRAWPRIASTFGKERDEAIAIADRTVGGDPIDLASGHVIMQQTDVVLPGLLELAITRTHLSSYRAGRWFGPSWASFLDQRLEIDDERVLYAAPDATHLCFPDLPAPGHASRPIHGPRLELVRLDDISFQITDPRTGLMSLFESRDGEMPLVAVIGRHGDQISLEYTPDGELALIRHSGGYRLRVRTEDNRITGLRLLGPSDAPDLGTDVVSYRYDESGRLAEVINSSGLPLRFSYDPAGQMTSWEDRNGTWYRYVYDERGRCIRTSGSGGCLERRLAYDEAARITAETDSLGRTTTYQLNELSQVVAVTDPLGNVTRTEWDAFDHRLTVIDAAGGATRFEYDDDGNLIGLQRPDGSVTRATYNQTRQPVSITLANGAVWRRRYDAAGNLVRTLDPLGAATSYEYGPRGRLVAVIDPRGAVTRFGRNAAGLVISATDPTGVTTTCERDAFGRLASIRNPAGEVTQAEYSPEGWLLRITLPTGATRTWRYDAEGNVVAAIDEQGQLTSMQWSNFDLPASRTQPGGSVLNYSYDTELRLIAVTNPAGQAWRFEYDAAGRMVREIDLNGRTISYRHDALGQVVERVNAVGQSVRYAYDPVGNLVRKQSAKTVTSYRFDALDQLVQASSPDADLRLERDPLGRVIAETSGELTSRFSYDTAGFRVNRSTPTGASSTWKYDATGLVAQLTSAGRSLTFAHDVLGREVERLLGAGTVLRQTWGSGRRLANQSVHRAGDEESVLAGRRYDYDVQGRLTKVDDELRGSTEFRLDPLGRVVAAESAGGSELFAYDQNGNVVQPATTQSADGEPRAFNGTLVQQVGPWRYQHDRQGRMTLRQYKTLSSRARNWHYSWDAEDRLTAVRTPEGDTWRYRYDGLGRRVSKQRVGAGGSVLEEQHFVWDGHRLAEQITTTPDADGAGQPVSAVSWEWLPDDVQPVTQTHRARRGAPDDQEWFDERFFTIVADLIGAPAEMVDEDGQVVWRSQATLWGAQKPMSTGDIDCPLAFPGQYRDAETGLHYNLFRYYDPVARSFASPDPVGVLAGPNPHTYVPNPLTHIDPLGLTPYPAGGGNNARRTIPLGFKNADDFAGFSADLRNGLVQAGHTDVTPIFQGSSVTGRKFTTGVPFDVGRTSDFDIALASPSMFERAKAAGISLRSGGTRTGPLSREHLQDMRIDDLAISLSEKAQRRVSFMIFETVGGALAKAGGIPVP